MGGAVGFEALPVIRKPLGEENLSAQPPGARVGGFGACPVECLSLVGSKLRLERFREVSQEIGGQRGELVPVVAALALRRRAIVASAELDQEVKRGHLHGFVDALGQLRVNALAQTTRVIRAVAEPGGAEGIVHQGVGNMRLRPTAMGSGVMPKSA